MKELKKIDLDATQPIEDTKPVTKPTTTSSGKPRSTGSGLKANKGFKIALKVLAILLIIVFVGGSFGAVIGFTLKAPVQTTIDHVNKLTEDFQNKDLVAAKDTVTILQSDLDLLNKKYKAVSWARIIPFLGSYVSDGQSTINASQSFLKATDLAIDALEPYSDLLGFTSDSEQALDKPVEESIENRIIFMAETLDKISPELEGITAELVKAGDDIASINPKRYPKTIAGKELRAKLVSLQTALSGSVQLFSQAKPLIKLLPTLLGNPDAKTYLLLFQNDAEIRATGGFLTAYAYLDMAQGKVKPGNSYDIYNLDARWNGRIEAPEPIKTYLKESTWNLRNMNLSPDFKVSMEQFMEAYRDTPGTRQIDGIIALDTSVPVKLLDIIGPIGVGGWGNFSSETDKRCDCPQVVYALEEIADKPTYEIRTGRKAVLGPLMHSLMANAMGSPKHMWPELLNSVLASIKEKHLLFYFLDEDTQKIAEDFNSAGRITDFTGDYLHINDSNFGGAKTDMFIERSVEQEIALEGDRVVKTVTINYDNPHKGSNCNLEAGQLCLNGTYRDWVRVYVPQGSELINVVGSEDEPGTGEELGKTYFSAFFTMRPQSQSKLVFKYKLPSNINTDTYQLLIQKQPGKPTIKHNLIYRGLEQEIDLDSDTTISL
jgi:hypothetical protein